MRRLRVPRAMLHRESANAVVELAVLAPIIGVLLAGLAAVAIAIQAQLGLVSVAEEAALGALEEASIRYCLARLHECRSDERWDRGISHRGWKQQAPPAVQQPRDELWGPAKASTGAACAPLGVSGGAAFVVEKLATNAPQERLSAGVVPIPGSLERRAEDAIPAGG